MMTKDQGLWTQQFSDAGNTRSFIIHFLSNRLGYFSPFEAFHNIRLGKTLQKFLALICHFKLASMILNIAHTGQIL